MGMPSLMQKKIVDPCWEISPFHLPARIRPGACENPVEKIADAFETVGAAITHLWGDVRSSFTNALRWFE